MHYDETNGCGLSPELADALPAYIDGEQKQALRDASTDPMMRAVAIGRLLRTGDASAPVRAWMNDRISRSPAGETAFVGECTRVLLLGAMELLGERAVKDPWVGHEMSRVIWGEEPDADAVIAADAAAFTDIWTGWVTSLVRQVDDAMSATAFLQQVSITQQNETPDMLEYEIRKLFSDVRAMAQAVDLLISAEVLADGLHRQAWFNRISALSADEWWLAPVRAARLLADVPVLESSPARQTVSLRARLTALADARLAAADDLPRVVYGTAQFVLRLSSESLLVILEESAFMGESHPITLEAGGIAVVAAEPVGQQVFAFPLTHTVFSCPAATLRIQLASGPVTLTLPPQ